MATNTKNTHIVLCNISLLNETQSIDWELDVVYYDRRTCKNIMNVCSRYSISLYLFYLYLH